MATGTRTSLTDTGNQKRAISDAIFMIDWTAAPLLNIFGIDSAKKFNLVNWPSTKAEIIEDTMSPYTSALSAGINNSTTTIPVTTGTGQQFRQGDIILIDSEKMLVISVSSDNLTVATRPYGSTTAASHSSAAVVTLLTRAMPEGANATTGHTTTTTQPFNWTQILSEAAQVTKTEQAMSKYGISDTMDYHVGKLFANGGQAGKLAQMLQRTFYYGERVQRSASQYGSMGGFKTFVTTFARAMGGASLQKSDIHERIRLVRDAGGEVTQIITGSWGMEKITAMYEGAIRMTTNEKRGGSAITMIRTPHGEVEAVYDWMCPPGEMYFTNKEKIGWFPMRPFETNDIKEQGDYWLQDVVGEYSFMVANERSHALLTGFDTAS